MAFVFVPTSERIQRASRLCKLVICMAAARKRAAATRATAELLKPLNDSFKALAVPSCVVGSSMDGASPSKTVTSAIIIAELTGYETASVTHRITAKAKMAKARCPATGSSPLLGKKIMIINKAKANPIHKGFKLRFVVVCLGEDIFSHPFYVYVKMTVIIHNIGQYNVFLR